MEPKINLNSDKIVLPANQIPSFKLMEAKKRNASDCWLFYLWGGLGDQVCSEPTIRWAHKNLPWKRFGVVTDSPEIVSHIDCEKFNTTELNQLRESGEWYLCPTIFDPKHLSWEFFSHMLVQAVDYVSINCLRTQLPVKDREIKLTPKNLDNPFFKDIDYENVAIIHAGKHWPSKTFPQSFWKMVVDSCLEHGLIPMLIGKTVDQNVGFVDFDFDPSKVMDYRNNMSLNDLIFVLQQALCLISNDSSAIHIAASGEAEIGCIATVKHPDYIKHWRDGIWGKGFTNLSKGGLWQKYSISPFVTETITCEDIDSNYLESILPTKTEIDEYLSRVYR